MIEFFNVSKQFPPNAPILVDIQFRMEKGEFVTLLGESGAGKTTLLNLIFCEMAPTTGALVVDGRNVSRMSSNHIAELRRNMGVIFQDFKLSFKQTVFHQVGIPLRVSGMAEKKAHKKVMNLLEWLGLEDLKDELPQFLSGGEQQRVAIARALVNDPKIILADEPTGNLDPTRAQEIMHLLKEINLRGATILMASHNEMLAQKLNCKMVRLLDGLLVQA